MKISTLLFSLLFLISVAHAQNTTTFPKSDGWVNDFNDILTVEEEIKLEKLLTKFEKKTTNEIAIVTIDAYGDYEGIEDYALALFNAWGIGKKDKNNGLLIVVCKQDRKMRIETGSGIRAVLTDELCKTIIDEEFVPEFKKDRYYNGILMGTKRLIKEWK
jgi:uncharacterized protein